MQIILPEAYGAYRRHCRQERYCDPFIPYVGADYGAPGCVKLAYCGGSAWWTEASQSIDDDAAALIYSKGLTDKFVAEGMYSTPFWRLFREIAAIVPGLAGESEKDVLSRFAWTNLSKTGVVGQSAPPDNDRVLRSLDVAQFWHEMDILRPDLLVCVSGSLVSSTGYALFDTPEWIEPEFPKPVTKSTWIRRAPWGGWLLWTMHPAYKPRSWHDSILADVAAILDRIGNEARAQ
jgi:hypothetical protein